MTVETFIHPVGSIDWYCERRGQGRDLVLIPSGEGDCAAFAQTAAALADEFTVLTFDTPGFSRSRAPAAEVRGERLAGQIAGLIRSLGIPRAAFYGCSSGGAAVLDLVAEHADLVTSAVIHEAAIIDTADAASALPLLQMLALDDDGIVAACREFFATVFNEDRAAWEALGPEYHARLATNYVTWVRCYIGHADLSRRFDPARIAQRPLVWTVGGLSTTARTLGNIRLAGRAGVEIQLLPCLHFPQVSIPVKLADHIRTSVRGDG